MTCTRASNVSYRVITDGQQCGVANKKGDASDTAATNGDTGAWAGACMGACVGGWAGGWVTVRGGRAVAGDWGLTRMKRRRSEHRHAG